MLRNTRTLCYLKVFSQLTWGNSRKLGCISTVRLHSFINTLRPCDGTSKPNIKIPTFIVTKDNIRFKSKSHGKNVMEDESSDEEDDKNYKKGEFDEEGGLINIVRLKSLRLDNFLRNGYNLSRRYDNPIPFNFLICLSFNKRAINYIWILIFYIT